jgi:Arc/MetJ family transcription regulator
LFDSPKVVRRLRAFKFVYVMTALRHFVRWHGERRYRLQQARLQFTGGTTPLDRQ